MIRKSPQDGTCHIYLYNTDTILCVKVYIFTQSSQVLGDRYIYQVYIKHIHHSCRNDKVTASYVAGITFAP